MLHALIAMALVGAVEFEATALDGRVAEGRLVEMSADQIVLETAEGCSTFPLASLATLTSKDGDTPAAQKATLWVEMVDASGLAAVEYTVRRATAHVTLTGGSSLEVPTRDIRWVRFSPPSGGDKRLAEQWADVTEVSAGGDLLVVRKDDHLDYLEGIVGDLDAETCDFQIDDEQIPVKRAKVEGLVYFRATTDRRPEASGRISMRDGSQLMIVGAILDGSDEIRATLVAGVTLALPLDQVTRVDFTTGKIAYLSDLDPESARYVPFFGFKRGLPLLGDFYGYRRDVAFENAPLELDGKQYRKGLALQSRTTLVYRLPGKFRVLKAVVGIDDNVRTTGSAKLRISADGETLWEGDVRGTDPPRELELAIDGARRLKFVVDYGDDQDVGDRVILCEARVTK